MIPNLRDVGKTVNHICGQEIMREGMLYRGGTVNKLADESELPDVQTILNLRTEEDQVFPSKNQLHIPAIDSAGNYLTLNGTVRDWVNKVTASICEEGAFPLLLHCTYGKDRTGIITALLLLAIGIERPVIIEEYMQTEGLTSDGDVRLALKEFGEVEEYLYEKDLITFLRNTLLKS
ncbi:MAG: tyrosine-protein phosphatase [Candidatus Electrothrix aestuarii]|uniref:Tyrosine-protein phosphatase n=1 Tax=Candidatus Electrothrix aestuarii TaxID=3062594 RepID=A0AAU8LY02_9BACT|nr:tyrosine-protein phosphatase [Candidatus Electrothrix aestuarii]